MSAASVFGPRSISTPEIFSVPHLLPCHTLNAISYPKEYSTKALCAAFAMMYTFLAGCNAMAGVGKDIQTDGQRPENLTGNAKRKM